jgi:hypothetical protein
MSVSTVVASVVIGSGISGPVPGTDIIVLDRHTQAFPAGAVDSVRRPGFNGREWAGRPITGQAESYPHVIDAERYGAWGHEDLRIRVQIQGLHPFRPVLVGDISPWQPVRAPSRTPAVTDPHQRAHATLARRLEEQRQRWLRENNFVGGVRTFGTANETHDRAARPEPRATIIVPEGFREREEEKFRVEADQAPDTAHAEPAAPAVHVSLPPNTAPRVRTVVAPAEAAESIATAERTQR